MTFPLKQSLYSLLPIHPAVQAQGLDVILDISLFPIPMSTLQVLRSIS